jgi:ATP-binding cassette subfamily B protein
VGAAFLLLTNAINAAIPELVQRTIDAVGERQALGDWVLFPVLVGVMALAVIVTRTLSRILFFNPGRTVEFRLKNDFFRKLLRMPPAFFAQYGTGELISRGTNDMTSVRSIIGFASLQLFNVVVAITFTVAQMLRIDATLTLMCAAPFVAGVFVMRLGIRALLVRFRKAQDQIAKLSDTILEAYSGVNVVQAFCAHREFDRRFDERNEAFVDTFREMALIRAFALPVVVVIGSTCLVLLLVRGGARVIEGDLTLGQVAAYASYLGMLVSSLQSTGWVINSIQRGLVSLDRVYDVLDAPMPPEAVGADDERLGSDGRVSLHARDLTVRYPDPVHPDQFREVLSQIRLAVPPGGTLGVFGPTGSGKSTLVSSIVRILYPPPGTVFWDERDVLEIPSRPLRGAIAVVPQDAYLFSRSLRENIGFSDVAKEIDEARLNAAVKAACLEEDIARFPQGLDTPVGERGVTLSGGQRQRVALARAFYRDFSVLVLDDVLSAVDHNTERRLIDAIRARASTTTTVIVSHRISALVDADWVVVLEGGRISLQGTHAELIAQPGVYRDTWDYQVSRTDGALVAATGGAV